VKEFFDTDFRTYPESKNGKSFELDIERER